ncbi:MAG: methyltransferase domain-containing protein, partial [Candidatus Hydrogenedentes bacterium]|nr:methyltransferase domain-containing protein [Candidatus Hydrogenedentota bacterium]
SIAVAWAMGNLGSDIRSYTSLRAGLRQRVVDVVSGVRNSLEDPGPRVGVMVERLRLVERVVAGAMGCELTGREILEIGPGQLFPQMIYFGRANSVTGIDLDVLAQGANLAPYWRMLRRNGPFRVAKTVARKALGYDRRYQRELGRALGLRRVPRLRCLQMDAAEMTFADESFDAVMSFSVFEHLPDPGRVLREIRRVLRPGGVAYISIHLYTCDNGCHDPRLYGRSRAGLPLWAHLRPAYAGLVRPNAYLNKFRLADWTEVFEEHMAGTQFERHCYGEEEARASAQEIRRGGELGEYGDEELFTVDLAAVWRKEGRIADCTAKH